MELMLIYKCDWRFDSVPSIEMTREEKINKKFGVVERILPPNMLSPV